MPDIGPIISQIAILAVPFLLAITCHEVAHGYVAYLLGDPTAKMLGRLTLNPLKHLDPLGTLALVVTRMIGWAKPVPVDASYFKNPRQGMMLVSLAGPAANFTLAVLFALAFKLMVILAPSLPAMSRLRLLMPLESMAVAGVAINVALGVFNLLPLPPLDGSNILAGLLPRQMAYRFLDLGRYGFIVLILLLMTGVLQRFIGPIIRYVTNLLI